MRRGIALDGVPETAPAPAGQATTFEVRCYDGNRLVFSAVLNGEIRDGCVHTTETAVTFTAQARTVVTSTCYWWARMGESQRNPAHAIIEEGCTLTLQLPCAVITDL